MPSSTSSFERSVPRGNWASSFLIAVAITLVALLAWEISCRKQGYAPTLNDTGDLWAARRGKVSSDPGQTVIIGSSRILFDFDLAEYARYFASEVPLQLAMKGAAPLGILEHLSEDEFRGTLICGIVPGLYFAPQGPPVDRATDAIQRYDNWSPSQRSGNFLGIALQKWIAFLNQEDLALGPLLASLRIPNRKAAQIPPEIPPYFATVEKTRQSWMWDQCGFETSLAKRIQQIWIPLFTPPPPPPHVTPEEFRDRYLASVESYLERTRISVERIRSRGGRVIFIRMPSSGTVREMETQFSPRQGFWDRILATTGCPGIHFEDHAELAGFDCPEWSHLTKDDAKKFTKNLMPILAQALQNDSPGQASPGPP